MKRHPTQAPRVVPGVEYEGEGSLEVVEDEEERVFRGRRLRLICAVAWRRLLSVPDRRQGMEFQREHVVCWLFSIDYLGSSQDDQGEAEAATASRSENDPEAAQGATMQTATAKLAEAYVRWSIVCLF